MVCVVVDWLLRQVRTAPANVASTLVFSPEGASGKTASSVLVGAVLSGVPVQFVPSDQLTPSPPPSHVIVVDSSVWVSGLLRR